MPAAFQKQAIDFKVVDGKNARPMKLIEVMRIPLALLGAFAVFVCLWVMDFPKPMNDDLFYCGAGLNLAQGGDLANPLLARQQFSDRKFLIYPPVHPCLLGGWLKVFRHQRGVHDRFSTGRVFCLRGGAISLLRRNGSPQWLEWLVPLAVGAAFLSFGLRPEALAAALTISGFALLQCGGRKALFPGFFLLALGTAAAPRIAPFGAALVLLAVFNLRHPHSAVPAPRFRWMLAGTGVLAAFLVFLAFG